MAENYFQHAEHYYRIVAQAYEQSGQPMRDRRDDREEFGRDDPQPDIANRENDERDRDDTREAQATSTKDVNGHESVGEDDGLRRTLRANGSQNGSIDADVDNAGESAAESEPPQSAAAEAAPATGEEEAEPKPKRRTRTPRPRRPRRTEGDAAPAESTEAAS